MAFAGAYKDEVIKSAEWHLALLKEREKNLFRIKQILFMEIEQVQNQLKQNINEKEEINGTNKTDTTSSTSGK